MWLSVDVPHLSILFYYFVVIHKRPLEWRILLAYLSSVNTPPPVSKDEEHARDELIKSKLPVSLCTSIMIIASTFQILLTHSETNQRHHIGV